MLVACTSTKDASGKNIVIKGYRGGPIQLFSPHRTYAISADGSGVVRYPSLEDLGDEPEWSSDGQWVVFVDKTTSPNAPKLYIMSSDGNIRIHIMVHPTGVYEPTWSPDGTYLSYFAYDEQQTGIYLLDVRCYKNQNNCVPEPVFLVKGHSPDWSPDGKNIVYEGLTYGLETSPDEGIYVINIDEPGEAINLIPLMKSCFDPDWSPDGTKIVLSCERDVYILNTDGSDIINLTANGGGTNPKWSPDGSKVLFVSERDGLGQHIGYGSAAIYSNALFMMNPDGTNIVRLSPNDGEEILWYSWLP